MATDLLFIYGTLLPGLRLAHEMEGAVLMGAAKVRGHLYDIGYYPGLTKGDGLVEGEIYRVTPEHLQRLDRVEEVVLSDQLASLYWRERIEVVSGPFAHHLVWVYRYNRTVKGLKRIPGGDYRRFMSES